MATIIVKDVTCDEIIAQSDDQDAILLEGSYYFDPKTVNMGHLVVTERVYRCPYKGTSFWLDLVGRDGTLIKDVAWMYTEIFEGYEHLRNRIGFAFGTRPGIVVQKQ
jgi:uncharacterized protein (DUF427 family)